MQRIVTVPSQKQCHSNERMGYVALALVMGDGEQIGSYVVNGGEGSSHVNRLPSGHSWLVQRGDNERWRREAQHTGKVGEGHGQRHRLARDGGEVRHLERCGRGRQVRRDGQHGHVDRCLVDRASEAQNSC